MAPRNPSVSTKSSTGETRTVTAPKHPQGQATDPHHLVG
jgi:hypothetical protein